MLQGAKTGGPERQSELVLNVGQEPAHLVLGNPTWHQRPVGAVGHLEEEKMEGPEVATAGT